MVTGICIPVYRRIRHIARIVENIRANTAGDYRIYFIAEEGDDAVRAAIDAIGERCLINPAPSTYARAINFAYRETTEPFFFCGADDVCVHPGWLAAACAAMTAGVGVVGTDDLAHPAVREGKTATHYLVRRRYIEQYSGVIDCPNTVLFEYDHNFTDTEFIATADMRGMYRSCSASVVEHLHPTWGKGEDDPTYQRGREHLEDDAQTYAVRRFLWESRR
jgi:hypothetical protein